MNYHFIIENISCFSTCSMLKQKIWFQLHIILQYCIYLTENFLFLLFCPISLPYFACLIVSTKCTLMTACLNRLCNILLWSCPLLSMDALFVFYSEACIHYGIISFCGGWNMSVSNEWEYLSFLSLDSLLNTESIEII